LKKAISNRAAAPTTSFPIWRSRDAAASIVPPVASTSSTISTRWPLMRSGWISMVALPYSRL
jgi:hypothetical protein